MPPLSIRAHGSSLRSCSSRGQRTCAPEAGCPLRPLRGHLPQRGRRDLAFCKLLVVYQLGSPFGGRYVPVGRCPAADRGGSRDAVAVRRLRGQPASASTQPMRGGRWQLALSVLANASPPPPKGEARLGFLQTSGCVPTWLPLRGPLRPGGTLPSGRSPLPRRSVMGAAHWAASPEPAGESAPAGGGEGFFSSLRRARALAS